MKMWVASTDDWRLCIKFFVNHFTVRGEARAVCGAGYFCRTTNCEPEPAEHERRHCPACLEAVKGAHSVWPPEIPPVVAEARAAYTGELFMGLPDAWYEKPGPKWRCTNGHVSVRYLKSERLGRPACLACMGHLWLTFPEDRDDQPDPENEP